MRCAMLSSLIQVILVPVGTIGTLVGLAPNALGLLVKDTRFAMRITSSPFTSYVIGEVFASAPEVPVIWKAFTPSVALVGSCRCAFAVAGPDARLIGVVGSNVICQPLGRFAVDRTTWPLKPLDGVSVMSRSCFSPSSVVFAVCVV